MDDASSIELTFMTESEPVRPGDKLPGQTGFLWIIIGLIAQVQVLDFSQQWQCASGLVGGFEETRRREESHFANELTRYSSSVTPRGRCCLQTTNLEGFATQPLEW